MSVEMVSTKPVGELSEQDIQEFAKYLRGDLLLPADDRFESSRVLWNAGIKTQPAMIVQAAGVSDILAAIDFAQSNDLPFSVKSGGHAWAGHALVEDGVTVDLSRLSGIRVDPVQKIVRAEAGALWKHVGAETSSFNLATPSGKISTNGVGGTTLGGGIGWLLRKYGMTIDNLLSVDIVTADGSFLTANTAEHADLFWAIRGGGGNFGVATSFEYRLYPVQMIYAGMILWPLSRASEVLKVYREYALEAPEELTAVAMMMTLPDGTKVVGVVGCYAGPLSEGERAFAPFLAIDQPLQIQADVMPYRAFTAIVADMAPGGHKSMARSNYAYELNDTLVDGLIAGYAQAVSPLSHILIEPFGGEAARVAPDETAYFHRDKNFIVSIVAEWSEDVEAAANRAWTEELWEAVRPQVSEATYVNFLDCDESHRIPAAYGANYDRLRAIKKQYDPKNFFRSTWNIPPAE
jgi:FAD/FMN-containing dehydrogenase